MNNRNVSSGITSSAYYSENTLNAPDRSASGGASSGAAPGSRLSGRDGRLLRGGLTASQLKLFAVVTMFIDHLTFTFLERTYDVSSRIVTAYTTDSLYLLDRIGRAVGRQAFPIFAFFIVEGFWHTRSRAKYLARLSVFAVISQLPFHLMCYTGPVGSKRTVSLNVYTTLALGLTAIWITDAVFMRYFRARRECVCAGPPRSSSPLRTGEPSDTQTSNAADSISTAQLILRAVLAAAAVAAISGAAYWLNTDYDYIGVITIVLFYLLRNRRRTAVMAVWVWMTVGSSMEVFAIAGLLLLMLYNGERGGRTGSAAGKYAFYVFYPAHMVVLWALRVLICGY